MVDPTQRGPAVSPLQQYAQRIRQRWLVIVVLAVVGGLAAGVWSIATAKTTWTATTAMTTTSQAGNPEQDSVLAQGYVDYFNQDSYQFLLRGKAGTPAGVLLSAKAAAASPMFYITASGPDKTAAATAATAATSIFIADIRASLEENRNTAVQALQTAIDEHAAKANAPGLTDAYRITVTEQVRYLQAKLSELQADTSNQITELQLVPGMAESKPSSSTAIVAGTVGGAILGVLLALALVLLDNRVRNRYDVRTRFGLETLAEFGPKTDPATRQRALATLANSMGLGNNGSTGKIVAVVAPRRTIRSSAFARDLIGLLGARRTSAVLMLADLRGPADPSLAERGGTSAVLARRLSLRAAMLEHPGGFRVLAPGEHSDGDAFAAFEPGRLAAVMRELAEANDVVLIDVPPILQASEAELLCGLADHVMLVVERDRSLVADVKHALVLLAAGHAPVSGVVLDEPDDDAGLPPLFARPPVPAQRNGADAGQPLGEHVGAASGTNGSEATDAGQPLGEHVGAASGTNGSEATDAGQPLGEHVGAASGTNGSEATDAGQPLGEHVGAASGTNGSDATTRKQPGQQAG